MFISRKMKDFLWQICVWLSALFTVFILVVILGFILYKGLPGINLKFLTSMWEDKTTFVMVDKLEQAKQAKKEAEGYVSSLGITIGLDKENVVYVKNITAVSTVKKAKNLKNESYAIKKNDKIVKINSENLEKMTIEKAVQTINAGSNPMRIKVIRPGGGIIPMFVSTLYLILLSLLIAGPIGILSAIYLNEYAKRGRLLRLIRLAIQNLAGIPSIIYGLFGMLFFVQMLRMRYSILAGAFTISIILLPTIISTTEEALKAIPMRYRESSLGLGATKLQTIYKVILPNAIPGILVAVILSIGRIVGESAALMLTAGTVAQIPTSLTGYEAGAATLTVKLYWILKETGDLAMASSIATILLFMIIILNLISKLVTRYLLVK